MRLAVVVAFLLTTTTVFSFVPKACRRVDTRLRQSLSEGDQVMLIGPGFLQLVLAKTCKAAGLRPLVVAPQKKLDNFGPLVGDDDIMKDGTIGMPEVGEPQFANIAAVVFCSEDAVLPATIVSRVLDYTDQGLSPFCEGGLKKLILCAPTTTKTNQEKSMSWVPFFNTDSKDAKTWQDLVEAYTKHPLYRGKDIATIVRYGSLFGGSVDGPEILKEVGLDEGIYKMTLEQFRDLKERAFDRYRLGAQVLKGDAVNKKPADQDKREASAIDNAEWREAFRILKAYPEEDRVNRHTVAQAVVQTLVRPDGAVPREMTVLGKAVSAFPTDAEWDDMFANPGPASWPDPQTFDPVEYGVETKETA